MRPMPTLLSFGHGYSAAAMAARLIPMGWRVIGTTRSEERMAEMEAAGVEPRRFGADLSEEIRGATHVLTSVPPKDGGDPVLERYGAELRAASPVWAGYLSTTAAYGDRQGGWVDESSALTPASSRGAARVAAESDWDATGLPLHIFRLAGIYGPGRGPFRKLRAGTARRLVKPNQFFSRIHVEDIGRVLAASAEHPAPPPYPTVWNLCDDEPAPPQDVMAHAARLLGMEPPPEVAFDEADLSPMARSFYGESKKVSNEKARRDFGPFLYPGYDSGLRAILEAETHEGRHLPSR